MADNIVGSLFGISPEQLMQQRQLRDVEQQVAAGRSAALPGSMMSPSLAPFYQQAAQQGQLIGRGVGALLGSEDPELQKVTQIKQLSSQFDLTTPQGMRDFAKALQQIAPNEAMMAAKRADEMEQSGLTRQKTQLDITGTQTKQAKQQRLEEEIAKLPDDATPEQLLAVYRKFGNPDQQASAIQRSLDAKANRELKFNAAAEKASLKAEGKSLEQKAMAQDTLDSAVEGIRRVDAITKDVSNWTVGAGSYMDWAPFTDAKNFKADVKTLQSQLDLAVLQAAKAQSKTGATGFGALNSKELAVIQTAISNLNTSLSPEKFKEKLDEVRAYFTKLQTKAQGTLGNKPSTNNADNDPFGLRN